MDNLIIDQKSITQKSSLHAWLYDLGFFIGSHPQAFTDCFDFKGIDKEKKDKFKSSSQGLSKTIRALIPAEIEGEYDTFDTLVSFITNDAKFQGCASMQQYEEIVMTGIRQAIGFIIIKSHSEIEKYSDLMQIRDNLNATQRTRAAVFRSAHTGEHGEDVIEMVNETYKSENKTIVDTNWFWCVVRYVMNKAITCQDTEALSLIGPVWSRVSNILPIQKNVVEPKLLPDIN